MSIRNSSILIDNIYLFKEEGKQGKEKNIKEKEGYEKDFLRFGNKAIRTNPTPSALSSWNLKIIHVLVEQTEEEDTNKLLSEVLCTPEL